MGERYTEEDAFRDRWRAMGLRSREIEHKWREFIEVEGYRESLETSQPRPPDAEIERLVDIKRRTVERNRKWGR